MAIIEQLIGARRRPRKRGSAPVPTAGAAQMGATPEQADAPHTAAAMAAAAGTSVARGSRGGDPYERSGARRERRTEEAYRPGASAARRARAEFYARKGWDVDDVNELSQRQAATVRRKGLFSDDPNERLIERLLESAGRREAKQGRLQEAVPGQPLSRGSRDMDGPEVPMTASQMISGSPSDPRVPAPTVEEALLAAAQQLRPRRRKRNDLF